VSGFDSTEDSSFTSEVCHDSRFLAVSSMDLKTGLLSVKNFKAAFVSLNRQPKLDYLKGEGTVLVVFRISRLEHLDLLACQADC